MGRLEDLLHHRLAMKATVEFGGYDGVTYVGSIAELLYSSACCDRGV